MKIFFSCSTHGFNKYKKNYYLIRDYLIKNGHIIVHDWLVKYKNYPKDKLINEIDNNEYKKIISAVERADVLIFEATVPSFSTGHLLTLAIQKKKPALFLWLDSSDWSRRKGFIYSIESQYIDILPYNLKCYKQVIDVFTRKFEGYSDSTRFNLLIDKTERQYLDWKSYNTFKTRSKLIRSMIRKEINNDEEYIAYLQGIDNKNTDGLNCVLPGIKFKP